MDLVNRSEINLATIHYGKDRANHKSKSGSLVQNSILMWSKWIEQSIRGSKDYQVVFGWK